jgi:hypothetical protein
MKFDEVSKHAATSRYDDAHEWGRVLCKNGRAIQEREND